jgi:metal-responsive CopG/Arc/MetJ family transcriptional regulator
MPANTSSAVIYRYKQKHYKRIVADLDREVVERWEERLKAEGIGKSEFIRNAILSYLESRPNRAAFHYAAYLALFIASAFCALLSCSDTV